MTTPKRFGANGRPKKACRPADGPSTGGGRVRLDVAFGPLWAWDSGFCSPWGKAALSHTPGPLASRMQEDAVVVILCRLW